MIFLALMTGCSSSSVRVQSWLTTGNREYQLAEQTSRKNAEGTVDALVTVDAAQAYQDVEGFGYTLTGGSARLIMDMQKEARARLLEALFGNSGIRLSYIRVSVGASDLNADVFTYDDVAEGETDPGLTRFSLEKDGPSGTGLIPLLKEIIAIRPGITILATPWTAPVWMKDNRRSIGGSLLPKYYDAYAAYLVKYVRAMQAEGIRIAAMTPQNEPLHGGNNPSMVMQAEAQAILIRDHLGPIFRKEGINTRIIIYDHNCNKPEYPLTVLQDEGARTYIDGSAFHLYEGDISALSVVKKAFPGKHLYFTEQWTGSKGEFDGDLHWHMKNVIIGSMRNWSRIALEWNLANDTAFGPHTPGGCTECRGALTIQGDRWEKNVAYYIIAHASAQVPPGSLRIHSEGTGNLTHVAFKRPDGKQVLILQNEQQKPQLVEVRSKGKPFRRILPARAVATMVW